MGSDIHIFYESLVDGEWVCVNPQGRIDYHGENKGYMYNDKPFDYRSYSLYGFLADVRNMSMVAPISKPRGLPKDWETTGEMTACHSYGYADFYDFESTLSGKFSRSWLLVKELLEYDYDIEFEDLRDGGNTLNVGEGVTTILREFLGKGYFEDLEILKQCGVERIVFGFES